MLGDNLTLFWYTLRQFKLAAGTGRSRFHLPDAELVRFLTDRRDCLALRPRDEAAGGRKMPRLVTGAVGRPTNASDRSPVSSAATSIFVLQPDGAGEVTIRFAQVTARGEAGQLHGHRAGWRDGRAGWSAARSPSGSIRRRAALTCCSRRAARRTASRSSTRPGRWTPRPARACTSRPHRRSTSRSRPVRRCSRSI
ncbi:MAG: hypothetical protein M5U09_18075 [Gammaproteobacteria bacterium]|nr:hypothetical protein [Gammaproteobacteria bacterium]